MEQAPSDADEAYRKGSVLLARSAAILRESADQVGLARINVQVAGFAHVRSRQGVPEAVELDAGVREVLSAGSYLRTLANLEARLMNNADAHENWTEAADHVRSLISIFATLKDPRLDYLGPTTQPCSRSRWVMASKRSRTQGKRSAG